MKEKTSEVSLIKKSGGFRCESPEGVVYLVKRRCFMQEFCVRVEMVGGMGGG